MEKPIGVRLKETASGKPNKVHIHIPMVWDPNQIVPDVQAPSMIGTFSSSSKT